MSDCLGNRLLAPLPLSLLLGVVICPGCSPELSNINGLSVKRTYRSGLGCYPDQQGRRQYLGHDIPHIIQNMNRSIRMISSVDITDTYDVVVEPEKNNVQFLVEAFEDIFELSIRRDSRRIPVYILTVSESEPLTLATSHSPNKKMDMTISPPPPMCCHNIIDAIRKMKRQQEPTKYTFRNCRASDLAYWLEQRGNWATSENKWSNDGKTHVVVNETNLQESYDFELIVDPRQHITILDSLSNLGLKLDHGIRPIEAIYVDTVEDAHPEAYLRTRNSHLQVYPAWP